MRQILIAAAVRGVVLAVAKATVERAGAQGHPTPDRDLAGLTGRGAAPGTASSLGPVHDALLDGGGPDGASPVR